MNVFFFFFLFLTIITPVFDNSVRFCTSSANNINAFKSRKYKHRVILSNKVTIFQTKNVYFLNRILYSNNIHIQIITCFCRRQYVVYVLLQGVQEKVCFFTIHCNPSLAYIAVSDLQSSQRNASVQLLLLAGNFLYHQ